MSAGHDVRSLYRVEGTLESRRFRIEVVAAIDLAGCGREGTRGALLEGALEGFPSKRIDPVTALPLALSASPLGIVIKSGGPAPKPARFWAYLWAADEESADDHWHQRVPTEHVA